MIIPTKTRAGSGGGGGATVFTGLTDVPNSYASQARKRLRVNNAATALQFYDEPFINAADYAAFDGVTDDTANIQSIINSIPASGGIRRIVCPIGKTALISTFLLIDKTNIIIDDLNIKLKSGATALGQVLYITANNVTLNRPIVDGNCQNNTAIDYQGILATPCDNLKILDYTVQNIKGAGVYLYNAGSVPFNYPIVKGGTVKNVGYFGIIFSYCKGGEIIDNDVISTGDSGIILGRGAIPGTYDNTGIVIRDNYITKATPPTNLISWITAEQGFLIAIDIGTKDCVIEGNICWDNRNAVNDGIGLGLDGVHPQQGIVIKNNIVYRTGLFGIDGTNGCVVQGNYIEDTWDSGIVVECDVAGDAYKNTIIDGNVILDPIARGAGSPTKAGINIVKIASYGGTGTVENIKISNNIVNDRRATKNTLYGFLMDSTNLTAKNVELTHNNLKNVSTDSVVVQGTGTIDTFIAKDNLYLNATKTITGATPSVYGYEIFKTNNASATTITSFLNGYDGQEISVVYGDVNTSLNSSGNIIPITIAPTINLLIKYLYLSSTAKWYEVK